MAKDKRKLESFSVPAWGFGKPLPKKGKKPRSGTGMISNGVKPRKKSMIKKGAQTAAMYSKGGKALGKQAGMSSADFSEVIGRRAAKRAAKKK